jgi:peptide chain release factor 2
LKLFLYAWVKLRNIFDLTTLNAKIQDLEQLSAQPEFWDNQEQAQNTLQELNDLKSNLEQYQKWQNSLEDTKAIAELLELEVDAALIEEAEINITRLQQELDQWELQQLLSGTYDKKGAVLTINAGAGGTDAQDWAEMLLRM